VLRPVRPPSARISTLYIFHSREVGSKSLRKRGGWVGGWVGGWSPIRLIIIYWREQLLCGFLDAPVLIPRPLLLDKHRTCLFLDPNTWQVTIKWTKNHPTLLNPTTQSWRTKISTKKQQQKSKVGKHAFFRDHGVGSCLLVCYTRRRSALT
jgi:hypothetical protein